MVYVIFLPLVVFYVDTASLCFITLIFVLCSVEIRNTCGTIEKFQVSYLSEQLVYDHWTTLKHWMNIKIAENCGVF